MQIFLKIHKFLADIFADYQNHFSEKNQIRGSEVRVHRVSEKQVIRSHSERRVF